MKREDKIPNKDGTIMSVRQ